MPVSLTRTAIQPGFSRLCLHPDVAAGFGVLRRVVEQIDQHLRHSLRITVEFQRLGWQRNA